VSVRGNAARHANRQESPPPVLRPPSLGRTPRPAPAVTRIQRCSQTRLPV